MQGIPSGGNMNKFELSLESHTSEHYSNNICRAFNFTEFEVNYAGYLQGIDGWSNMAQPDKATGAVIASNYVTVRLALSLATGACSPVMNSGLDMQQVTRLPLTINRCSQLQQLKLTVRSGISVPNVSSHASEYNTVNYAQYLQTIAGYAHVGQNDKSVGAALEPYYNIVNLKLSLSGQCSTVATGGLGSIQQVVRQQLSILNNPRTRFKIRAII
jgi:hypothetical protein